MTIWFFFMLIVASILVLRLTIAISHYHLRQFSVNSTAISITSFAYSPSKKPPEWVEKVLGPQAVFWQVKGEYFALPGGEAAVAGARDRWRRHMVLPDDALLPSCSVEMIGYARLGPHAPFRGKEDRKTEPSAGMMHLMVITFHFPCYICLAYILYWISPHGWFIDRKGTYSVGKDTDELLLPRLVF